MRVLVRLIAVLLLLAAGSGLYWVDTLRRAAPEDDPTAETPHEPVYYFTDFTLRRFEHSGPPTTVLAGARMTQFADDDTSLVERPDFDYRPADAPPWAVTAARARVGPDGERVELIEEVVLRQRPPRQPPITVRTSRMTVRTDRGRADTDRRVDAVSPGWRVRATGMTAWFERDLLELHNDVDGRYDPQAAR